jgi:MSHA biogenesis protein MshQ
LGVANISVPLAVYRGVTPVGAYTLLDVGVAPLDSDGSILSAYDLDTVNVLSVANNHAIIGRTQVRYGRIRLQNAYGSELLDLPMPLTAEYWDGTSWITNTDEQYTKDLTMSATVVTGPLTTVCAWDTGLGIGNSGLGCSVAGTSLNQYRAPPTGGDFNLNFKAPGSGNTGTMEITATVPSYLMFNWKGVGNANPIAIANFGIYKGNSKIIYIRELY